MELSFQHVSYMHFPQGSGTALRNEGIGGESGVKRNLANYTISPPQDRQIHHMNNLSYRSSCAV